MTINLQSSILKKIFSVGPELYLLFSVVYYWSLTALVINPLAIFLVIVVTFQIWERNKVLGIVISALFLFLNLFLVLALISELSEFTEFNKNAVLLLTVGSLYLGLNIFFSVVMLYRYLNRQAIEPVIN
jgi:hypothetical protein